METLKKGSFLLLAAVLGIAKLQAQTADEIINKNIEAVGGKALVISVKTIYVESTIDIMGTDAPSTTNIVYGKGTKSETDFNGTKFIQSVSDKGGWKVDPTNGAAMPTAMSDAEVKAGQAQYSTGGPLFDYAGKGFKAELIGKDSSGGKLDYKIKLTGPNGMDITYYINASTWLVDKTTSTVSVQGQEMEVGVTFSDYKKTDFGLVMAYSQERVLPTITLPITIKKIEINKTIDPAIFDMPK